MFFKSKSPNPTTLEKFRQNWPVTEPSWLALDMNQNIPGDAYEAYTLEVHQGNVINRLSWRDNSSDKNLFHCEATLSNKSIFSGSLSKENELYKENLYPTIEGATHFFFKQVRELLVSCGKRQASGSFNPQEAQGKEWLRVSLEVLKKALANVAQERSKDGPEVLQGLLFCGYHPTNNKFTFRLRIFNLDIEVIEDETQSLRVMVFDKKNKDSFSGLEPALKMVFIQEKAPVLDQFITLLPNLSSPIMPI